MFDTPIYIDAGGVQLALWHDGSLDKAGRKPVLLLHGASANHRTFITPEGDRNLASSLIKEGHDPWLLDWRGSSLVVDDPTNKGSIESQGCLYNFNEAAERDVRAALCEIRRRREDWGGKAIGALGFCMGAAVLAEALALGCITDTDVDCLVLMTLGLFYTVPIDGRLKSEDHTLEELQNTPGDTVPGIDPRPDSTWWPVPVNRLFELWPQALKWHTYDDTPTSKMCNRVSFMFGMPYCHENLVSEIHSDSNGKPVLSTLFGTIPLDMYIHGAQNIRTGQATFYECPLSKDPTCAAPKDPKRFVSDDARRAFKRLTKISLITGDVNRLWHRDSIDRMHEWLMRGPANSTCMVSKHVIPGYGHQDLLWGRDSPECVFTSIVEGLKSPTPEATPGSASRPKAYLGV
jgi:pimeloyl-ACP methyl ester carboxylesterase